MSYAHAVTIEIDQVGAETERVIRPAGTGRILRKLGAVAGKLGTWTEIWFGFRCRWRWADFRTPGQPSGYYGTILDGGYGQISWGLCSGPACWGDNSIPHAVGVWGPDVASISNSRGLYGGAAIASQAVWAARWQNNVRSISSGTTIYQPSDQNFRSFYITRLWRDDGYGRTVIARCWPDQAAMATDQSLATFLACMKKPTWTDLYFGKPANYSADYYAWTYLSRIDEVTYGLLDHFYLSAIKSYSYPLVSDVLIRVI